MRHDSKRAIAERSSVHIVNDKKTRSRVRHDRRLREYSLDRADDMGNSRAVVFIHSTVECIEKFREAKYCISQPSKVSARRNSEVPFLERL